MIWDLKQFGDSTALIEGDKTYTYSVLSASSEEIAAQLAPRSLAFILCTNTAGSVSGYLGLVNAGHVPLLLDSQISRELLNNLRETYRPAYLWVPESMEMEFPAEKCVYRSLGYSLLDTGVTDPYALHPELCVLISTSGSTGSPKLVRQARKNILSNTKSIIEYLGIDSTERAITSLPMNYVYGLSVLNTHIYAGASLVLTEKNPYSKQFWNLVREHEVTSFAGVPFTYEMMDKLRITKLDLPSLRYMTQAGGKLSPELQKKFALYAQERGMRFVVMYGASEATARMGYLPPDRAIEKQGSMGIPIPGGRFELVDVDEKPIAESGQVGELVYYGENVTLGYSVQGSDLAKEDENKGRLGTGDMAYRDDDGFYYIVGRKKRFLKMLGKRVNLDETESILKKQFQTLDIACSGKDDELRIFVVDESLMDPVADYVFKELDINRRLLRLQTISEIPKNNSGKILYSALEDL